jgi:hypothetical protein
MQESSRRNDNTYAHTVPTVTDSVGPFFRMGQYSTFTFTLPITLPDKTEIFKNKI